MRFLSLFLLTVLLFASCAKYSDKKVEGVWLLKHVNLCTSGRCFDTLEDRGTRDKYDKIELHLNRDRTCRGRFYKSGILQYQVDFEYLLDEEMGRISFIGPYDTVVPSLFGTNVSIEQLTRTEMVNVAIEDFPDDETAYIYSRLQ